MHRKICSTVGWQRKSYLKMKRTEIPYLEEQRAITFDIPLLTSPPSQNCPLFATIATVSRAKQTQRLSSAASVAAKPIMTRLVRLGPGHPADPARVVDLAGTPQQAREVRAKVAARKTANRAALGATSAPLGLERLDDMVVVLPFPLVKCFCTRGY